jgi:hypothetical protein
MLRRRLLPARFALRSRSNTRREPQGSAIQKALIGEPVYRNPVRAFLILGTEMDIEPIDKFVLAGFAERFQQTFGAVKCAYVNANDKVRILQRVFGEGNQITYPYAYLVIKSQRANDQSYNPGYLSRRGIVININSEDTYQTVRILPVDFEIECTYVTNKFSSVEQGSILSFARRMLMARRNGYLKFSIDYGMKQFGIGVDLEESVSIPSRENITESETSMEITVTATVHGYISEPVLGEKGKINKFNVSPFDTAIYPNQQIVSTQTFAFPDKKA